MRDLSECKAEIRRQIEKKAKTRSIIHKRFVLLLSVCTVAIACFCAIIIVPNVITNNRTVYILSDDTEIYDSFEEIVNGSDLIFIGTVECERVFFDDQSAPENVKTEYSFVIEHKIFGDYDSHTITVNTKGGTVNNVTYMLKGGEKYVVGERYIVFLSDQRVETIAAVVSERYTETSPLLGKIHVNGNRIDSNAASWNSIDDFPSTKSVDELVQLIQIIKEET